MHHNTRSLSHARTHAHTQVDFLPAKSLSSEQLAESQRAKEQAAKAMRSANVVIDGHERKYQVSTACEDVWRPVWG